MHRLLYIDSVMLMSVQPMSFNASQMVCTIGKSIFVPSKVIFRCLVESFVGVLGGVSLMSCLFGIVMSFVVVWCWL